MKLEDLSDIEAEQLTDKCYDDLILIEDFIATNYEDFEECMYSRGIDTDHYPDYEFQYCESNLDKFVQFGFDKYYGGEK